MMCAALCIVAGVWIVAGILTLAVICFLLR